MRRVLTVTLTALVLGGLLAGALLVSACGGSSSSSSSPSSEPIATVGKVTIPKADFDQLMNQAKAQAKTQGQTISGPGTQQYDAYAAQIVSFLVQMQVVEQNAAKYGATVSEKAIDDRVAAIEKQNGGAAKVLSILKQQGMTMDQLRESLRQQAITRQVATKVVAGAKVTPAQVKAYWDANKATLSKTKATSTFAKAKKSITQTVLANQKQTLWLAWVKAQEKALGVTYADGYDPTKLTAAATASPSPSASK